MRPVYFCALFIASLPGTMAGGSMDVPPSNTTFSHPATPDVTVVLDIKGSFPPGALRQMQSEAENIIGAAGIELGWRMRDDVSGGTFHDLVVLTFKGACVLDPIPFLHDELGPYAFTRVSNGEVQPFGVVDCARVVNSVKGAMFGNDYSKSDLLMGRALGRVVAHELVHMLTKSGRHAPEGVYKASLSGKQLISASLPLTALDIDRLRRERARTH
jgi:hypothetical protein